MSDTVMPARAVPALSLGAWLVRHWFGLFMFVYGTWIVLPFLAPVLMKLGWDGGAGAIYFLYSFFCHQLPERSFFLFGQEPMYSLTEIRAAWQDTINPLLLRRFIGNEVLGWKIAWSDRMISFYSSVWIFALAWAPLRRRVRPLSWWGFVLLLLPIVLDGSTHTLSDLAGIGQGFRDTNRWLATLTNNALPATFYVGDALGSFNSLMRLFTGVLAGLGIVWLAFPYVSRTQALKRELDTLDYGRVLENIRSKNTRPSG